SFTYQHRACEKPTRELYKNADCGDIDFWISKDAPAKYSHFTLCADDCKFFTPTGDSDRFSNALNWSTTWDNYVGLLAIDVAGPRFGALIACLKTKGITASIEGGLGLNVPAGLEHLARQDIARCGFGSASQAVTEKGSETVPLVFPHGTFFR